MTGGHPFSSPIRHAESRYRYSQEEVDEVLEQARRAGAVIVKEAQSTFWGGYAGYFQDPDGHLWEIVWNPHLVDL